MRDREERMKKLKKKVVRWIKNGIWKTMKWMKINSRVIFMFMASIATLLITIFFVPPKSILKIMVSILKIKSRSQLWALILKIKFISQLIIFLLFVIWFIQKDRKGELNTRLEYLNFPLKVKDLLVIMSYIICIFNIFIIDFYYTESNLGVPGDLETLIMLIEILVYCIMFIVVIFKNIYIFAIWTFLFTMIAGFLNSETTQLLSFIVATFGLILDYDFLESIYHRCQIGKSKYSSMLGITRYKLNGLSDYKKEKIKNKVHIYKFIPGIVVGLYNLSIFLSPFVSWRFFKEKSVSEIKNIEDFGELLMQKFKLGIIRFCIIVFIVVVVIAIIMLTRKYFYKFLHYTFDETVAEKK